MKTVDEPDGEVSQATRSSSREKQPNVRLNFERIERARLQRLKNSKRGLLSTVTLPKNEIKDLIYDDNNLNLVKEKLQSLSQSFIKYSEAHQAYQDYAISVENIVAEQNQYEAEEVLYSELASRINEWITEAEFRLNFQSEIFPQDSASQINTDRSVDSSHKQSSVRTSSQLMLQDYN